ncbi:uncharacterized protein LOC129581259 [Paramacrobiotus metropolitanus]|uniref:uncharacterized protein LOC129581259 n=1 Tax=Paramacrobiotus metropolitanus TaxID=2943436 RepID=UPI0024462575|nr:uncharacterized protein LOC129581259 [Paramacrobiotus metropolitanus]XP_055328205.1 uncharacterized protein LOC129581259 [Paramacrobiotus metropolitanus]XP_055328206.1 uncharacterized protein LOC129581259 [Paramacrobiotus metropolitanus]
MPKTSKPKNAYSFYVTERCSETKTSYSQGFSKFSEEWDRLGPDAKKVYFAMAEDARELSSSRIPNAKYQKAGERTTWRQTQPQGNGNSPEKILLGPTAGTKNPEQRDLTVQDMIPDVAHGIGEFVLDGEHNNRGEDVPAPAYEDIEVACVTAIDTEYPEQRNILVQKVVVIGCVPLVPVGCGATPINRPVEISLKSFHLTTGFSNDVKHSFHAFIDPGPVTPDKQLVLTDARKNCHKIPYAAFIKGDSDCKRFHEGFRLRKDYYDLYKEMSSFVQTNHRPIVALGSMEDIATTWACLEWLHYQATEDGKKEQRPSLKQLTLSTVDDYVGHAMSVLIGHHSDSLLAEEFERIRKTFSLCRYRRQRSLQCLFHKQVDTEMCADAMACERIYTVFDLLRDYYSLPTNGPFTPRD